MIIDHPLAQMEEDDQNKDSASGFLAVQNSSIGDLVPCLLGLTPLTIRVFTILQSDPRDL